MTRILVTMPGKYGDILWAMPTARAIAETFDCAVDFMVSGAYGGIAPLIHAQDYIEQAIVNEAWKVQETAPITPWAAPLRGEDIGAYDHIFDLGYRGWPTEATLAEEVYKNGMGVARRMLVPLDLNRPWIEADPITHIDPFVFVGWSDQWIELKMGVTLAVLNVIPDRYNLNVIHPVDSRHKEWKLFHDDGNGLYFYRADWLQAVRYMETAECYLGCLSAQWVLANAMGKKTVVMEPDPQRARNPLFWLPRERNHMVIGGDALPTHDARHTGDLLREVLNGG